MEQPSSRKRCLSADGEEGDSHDGIPHAKRDRAVAEAAAAGHVTGGGDRGDAQTLIQLDDELGRTGDDDGAPTASIQSADGDADANDNSDGADEADGDDDDDDDDDDASASSEPLERKVLPQRMTRGKRMARLVGEAAEADQAFWGQSGEIERAGRSLSYIYERGCYLRYRGRDFNQQYAVN